MDAFPVDYATNQASLGDVYRERIAGDRQANLEQAIICHQEALRIFTLDAFPVDYATTQDSLGNAYTGRIAGEQRANLEQAITCYQEALCIFTLEAFPVNYAMTQTNLGNAYAERVAGEQRVNLEQAIACHQEALRVYTLGAFPVDYATAQTNLGNVYAERIAGERRANLEQAIACHQEALRIYTLEAFPHKHYWIQLNRAFVEASRQNWTGVHDAYSSALVAEAQLVALGAGTAGRDVVLKEGLDVAVRDGFALIRLARLSDAVMTIERGRAQGLAEAMAFDAANPGLIHDVERRARYETAREQLIAAQKALNTPMSRELAETEERRINLEYTKAYSRAKDTFDAIVAEIREAKDPADFLQTALDPLMILQATEQSGLGHALVYLAATPWGGVAVATLSAKPDESVPTRFATLDLPNLTYELVFDLLQTELSDDTERCIGGFAYAQEGSGFDWVMSSWENTTFRMCAAALHEACIATGQTSTLDAAAQATLAISALGALTDQPLDMLNDMDRRTLTDTFNHHFLTMELRHCLEVLANVALRPLVTWLQKQGTATLTLIPCGLLAAFPLAAVPLDNGRTVGETLPTSVAPSARSLLHDGEIVSQRTGVYALGDPWPTTLELRWGEAEVLTLAKLANQLEQRAEASIHEAATRSWLIKAFNKGYIVDASCHGGFDIGQPLQSALFLAEGEQLVLGDILSHVADLRGLRLLILSACQTAILDLRGALNEVRSLSAGMVQAGAQAVLAALWPVDQKATYLLMVRFAQEWLPHMENEPPAKALARAQHWLRRVTNRELLEWRASDFPVLMVEEGRTSSSQTSEQGSRVQEAREPDETSHKGPKTVNGHAYRSEAVTELVIGRSRFGVRMAELRVRASAYSQHAPDACPYADPIYWAGFQITGW